MTRTKHPDRIRAEEIYLEHKGNIELAKIAEMLGRPRGTIRNWKRKDRWDDKLTGPPKRKTVSLLGNKNAVGHGAPKGNKNSEKHGFFAKHLPEETMGIIQEIQEKSPLEILWENIQIQYAAIIRAQRIMFVKDKNDKTVEKVGERGGKIKEERWEVQQAWDKYTNFLQAQSRAMAELRNLIRQYDELLHANRDLATEEQKMRIEKLRADVNRITGSYAEVEDLSEIYKEIYGDIDEDKED